MELTFVASDSEGQEAVEGIEGGHLGFGGCRGGDRSGPGDLGVTT